MTANVFRVNTKVHPAILQGKAIRDKIKKRLEIPNRADFDREARYKDAVNKRELYLKRITKVLIVILREYDRAKAKQQVLTEMGRLAVGEEFYHVISLTKLYVIMAGGGKFVPRSKTNPELTLIPNSSTYNEETKMLVECFFEQRLRGNNINGSSKWVAKDVPKFGDEIIALLNKIHDDNKSSFDIIKQYLIDDGGEDPDYQDVVFDVMEKVDVDELNKLYEAILGCY